MKSKKMNKQKTKKSIANRFRVTKKGKVLHRSHNLRHLRSNKSKSRIRGLKRIKILASAQAIKIKKLIT